MQNRGREDSPGPFGRLKQRLGAWAKIIKRDLLVLYLAGRDPRVPWYAKLLALAAVAYALSPIDLIPDFIPVLGYLDDALLLPLAILLALRLIPPQVLAELRQEASRRLDERLPRSRAGLVLVAGLWLLAALLLAWLLLPL